MTMTTRLSRRSFGLLAAGGAASLTLGAPSILRAQGTFPSHPIHIVVPFDTGGIMLSVQRLQAGRRHARVGNPQQRAIAGAPTCGGNACLPESYD
jgi:tripartite-type tricarboxylate transporter receptor subunit TctC